MSRLPWGKILKVSAILVFVAVMPLVVLGVGLSKKDKNLILEGAIYVILWLAAFSIPENSALYTLASSVGVGVIAISGVRLYMLRDLWLNRKVEGLLRNATGQRGGASQPDDYPSTVEEPAAPSTVSLSQALAGVTSAVRKNENRLPAGAHVSILETCRTLGSVIETESRQPLGDPEFEYELSAMVHEYLPEVLRSYLAIPQSMVKIREVSGRTPVEEFLEQLQLLSDQAQRLHSSRHRHTSAELTTMGNFLRERFGHPRGHGLDLGKK